MKLRHPLLLIGLALALALPGISATDLTCGGSWSQTIGVSNLVGGAGTDLTGTYECQANSITLTTLNAGASWQINVKRTDTDWPSALALYIKRTSAGTGGSVSGGDTYQTVSTSDTQFLTGSGDIYNIGIQEKVTGVSVSIPPGSYGTTVVFTVIDQ